MAGHFSSIGFPVANREELEALAVLAANVGETREAGELLYARWVAGGGAEVWALAERAGKTIKGVTPFFASGEAVIEGTIERALPNEKRPHEGMVAFIPSGEQRATLAGVLLTVPDFRLALPRLAAGTPAAFSIAAFAHAFELVTDAKSLGDSGLMLGMMLPAMQGLTVVAGRVVRSERRTNPSGRRDFIWALLEVDGGKIDVLLDPDLHDVPLDEGALCRGAYWLSGRLAPPA
jgi:hypothetical protein